MRSRPPSPRRSARRSGWFAAFVVAAGLASAAALVIYGVMRGGFGADAHAEWREWSAAAQAAGEPLFVADVMPAPAPAEENFFAADVFAGLAEGEPKHELVRRALAPVGGMGVGELLAGATKHGGASLEAIGARMQEAGLVRRQTEFLLAGDRVRAGMRALGLEFAPLVVAADRPAAWFPVDAEAVFPPRPHLAAVEALGNWLAIRAIAALSVGDGDSAAVDLLLIGRLADALTAEPFAASQAARRRLLGLFAGCVRVGIQWDAWTGEQLARFGGAFARERPIEDLARAVRGERAQFNTAVERALAGKLRQPPEGLRAWLGPDAAALDARTLRRRQVAINRAAQTFLDALARPGGLEPAALAPGEDAALPAAARERLAAWAAEARTAAQIGTYLAQAEVACALERYRLVHGAYPERLDALVPEVLEALPEDPVSRGPLDYARPRPEAFSLGGAGWGDAKWTWTRNL